MGAWGRAVSPPNIMVDRITKIENNPYRVQDAADDKNRRNRGEQEHREEKDKFEKSDPTLKNIIPGTNTNPGLARFSSKKEILAKNHENSGRHTSLHLEKLEKEDDEKTQPIFIRFLILWGFFNANNKPRIFTMIVYLLFAFVALSSTILIVRILWR